MVILKELMSSFLFHCPQKVDRIASASLCGREHKYNPILSLKDQGYFYHFFLQSSLYNPQWSKDKNMLSFYLGRILQCQGRAWKVLWDPCNRSVEKAQGAALVGWDTNLAAAWATNLAAAWASSLLQKPLEVKSCPNLTISTFFFFDRKNLILFELFIDIEIQNLEAHQPLKALPGRSLSAFLWPGLLLPARQSWKVSPWAPNTEWKPWMLSGHKLKPWTHSNWIFILSIL